MKRNTGLISRRGLLRWGLLAPLGYAAACGGSRAPSVVGASPGTDGAPLTQEERSAAPPPEPPFVLPAGEERRLLMAGTRYETPLYVFASGRPGRIILVLGGVHGNEPAGWLAAERVVERVRPESGALLVVPRANKVADSLFERTTPELADLNRSYPGFADGLPMERMALEIVDAIREFHVDLVHDMHESWSFYRDRTTNGTAFLGQTIATNGEAGATLIRSVVEAINARVLATKEEFFFRDFGGQNAAGQPPNSSAQDGANLPRQQNVPPPGRGTSSLGLNRFVPGLVPILVEMGQQQALERRIALHVDVLTEVMREVGVGLA